MNPKVEAARSVDTGRDALIDLSHRIHAHPELGFEEERASTWLAEPLDGAGFAVEHGVYGLPTAFLARAGHGPLHVAICAEYDALPGIGHACGHNIIGTSAIGAGLALARVADDVGLTVTVVGTPAEEVGDGGGKILLLERGAFADQHLAMMVHPSVSEAAAPGYIAASTFRVRYRGKESHAAAAPHLGVNAADALTIAQTAIGLLRQHLRPLDRVHGIITRGGDAPNVIPAETTATWMVRAETLEALGEVQGKVYRCFEAGALATGATLEITGGTKPYAQMRPDPEIAAIYQRNAEARGRRFPPAGTPQLGFASTDMGNVSLALPAIHPRMSINSSPATNHQPEFAAHCITQDADRALLDAAIAMAWTAIDLAQGASIRERLLRR